MQEIAAAVNHIQPVVHNQLYAPSSVVLFAVAPL